MQHIGQTYEQAAHLAAIYNRLHLPCKIERKIETHNGLTFYTWIVLYTGN